MKQKIFLGITILLLTLFGISIYSEFMTNHTYYYSMFSSRENRKLIVRVAIAALLPIGYMLRNKTFSLKSFAIKWLPAGLVLFTLAHTLIKESILGSTGFIILCINTLLIYFLSMYFILGTLSIGTWISNKRIKFSQTRRQELFINFGIGLGAFLLLIKILAILDIFYGIVSRILFLGLGVAIYFSKKQLSKYREILEDTLSNFRKDMLHKNPITWIGLILIAVSIIYYYFGFQLSFIPYSTAWDANHEYMYIPKIIAANHGILRGNNGPGAGVPGLRHMFITFWFGLAGSLKKFWIGPDTIAVAMNFLSGIFVLLMGLGTIRQIIDFFAPKNESEEAKTSDSKNITFYLGWLLLILWITSGMGAFLVFVDNKTDMGVMTMTMLAILSGFVFLHHIKEHKENGTLSSKETIKYIITSGAFFALASMSKQTAFIDIALFGLLIVALRFNNIIAIGLGIAITGMTGIMGIANAKDLITTSSGKRVAIIGILITIIGIVRLLLQKKDKKYFENFKKPIKYIAIRIGALIAMLVVFKGPHLIYSQIQDSSFSIGTFSKNLLLGKTEKKVLLATNESTAALETQTQIDQAAKKELTPAQCAQVSYTKEELNKGIKKAFVGNEDVGRYVGYGRKELSKSNGLNIGYGLLRIFYPKDNTCYGLNHDAKILCKNSAAVDNFDVNTLAPLLAQMKVGSQTYNLLSGALQKFYAKGYTGAYNPAEFRDQIVSLRQFYQSHAIKTEKGKISIPYRYIIPLNISFNWSLQNLSSYYTDIGFIWVFAMGFVLLGLVYGLVQKQKKLVTISTISILGRTIWWMIGGGILWYGMGLIIWTILATIMFIYEIIANSKKESDKNLMYIGLFLFAIWCIIQLFFNLIRISSQGAGGPFARYKMNIGKTTEFDDMLQATEKIQNGYGRKDVFDMQFPHYNGFINYVENRKNEDGVLIAGTYIQYFIKNQWNIKSDGMLNRFREQASDGDGCKTVQRLKNGNVKYLVVDPNIGTVGMGEGNESLFQRFFAKLDPISGKIQEDGAMSMLVKLNQEGYLKLFSTNNLGAKYAFTLSDDEIRAGFGSGLSSEDLIFTRTKLAIARYFQDSNNYISFIGNTFTKRIASGKALGDIANVYGKDVNERNLINIAKTFTSGGVSSNTIQKQVAGLSQDERLILAQYLAIYNIAKSGQDQLQQAVNSVLGQSLGGSSQVMIFERQ